MRKDFILQVFNLIFLRIIFEECGRALSCTSRTAFLFNNGWLRFRKFFVHLLISHKMFLRLNCFAWFKTGIVYRPANYHRNSSGRSACFSELSRALSHFNHRSDRFRLLNTVHFHWSRFCVKGDPSYCAQ